MSISDQVVSGVMRRRAGACRLRQRGNYIGLLVPPAALLTSVRKHLAQRPPKSQRTPDVLVPIFGHYLRTIGRADSGIIKGRLLAGSGTVEHTTGTRSVNELYEMGIDSGMRFFECLLLVRGIAHTASIVSWKAQALLSPRNRSTALTAGELSKME
jgi:hypothetical protein